MKKTQWFLACVVTVACYLMLTMCSGCDANPFGGNGNDWTFNQSGHEFQPTMAYQTGPSVRFDDDGDIAEILPGNGVVNLIIIDSEQQDSGFLAGSEASVATDEENPTPPPDEESSD
jgi:hypothetical protein